MFGPFEARTDRLAGMKHKCLPIRSRGTLSNAQPDLPLHVRHGPLLVMKLFALDPRLHLRLSSLFADLDPVGDNSHIRNLSEAPAHGTGLDLPVFGLRQ